MEYTHLINEILEAERSAQAIAGDVKRRQSRLDEELSKETAALRTALNARTAERISAITKEAAAGRDAAIRKQEQRKADVLARMERAYRHYGDNWVDTLFRRIVGDRP